MDIDRGMELDCRWHFLPQSGRDRGLNNAMAQNFKENPYSALVRESIQNSLDAVFDESRPVEIEISFSNLNHRNYPNFFELREHIKGCKDFWEDSDNRYASMEEYLEKSTYNLLGYIHISDSNTKGMEYRSDNDKKNNNSPFYAFVQSEGNSYKEGQQTGGSFGFGKAAYFQISPISTLLISTLTTSGQYVFEGVSQLCTHNYKGEKVCDVGFYDNNNGKPIVEFEDIPQRFRRNKPGTSFYIIGYQGEKSEIIGEMIPEILRSFWYAIYSNKLVIKISNFEINSDSLAQFLEDNFEGKIDNKRDKKDHNPIPYYLAVKEANQSDKAKVFTQNFPILGKCRLYLIKIPEAKDRIAYMRRPLMLVYSKRTRSSNYGVHGLFVCDDIQGDKILRKTENSAHNEWKPTNYRDNNQKIVSKGVLAIKEIEEFVSQSLKNFFVDDQNTALEIPGLKDLLYIPEEIFLDEKITNSTNNSISGLQSSTLNGPMHNQTIDPVNIGSVRIVKYGTISNTDSDHTHKEIIGVGGHSFEKSRIKGGSATAGNVFKLGVLDNSHGTHKRLIPVTFRVIAQLKGNVWFHNIYIYSDEEVKNAELEIVTIGEQSDDAIDILYSSIGNISSNFVRGVNLKKDKKNLLSVRFKDDMRHSIKLKAYED